MRKAVAAVTLTVMILGAPGFAVAGQFDEGEKQPLILSAAQLDGITAGGPGQLADYLILRAMTREPGGFGKGLAHVFGGILAINIIKTIEIVNNILYPP